MGKWPVPSLANFFHHVVVVHFAPDLFMYSNADALVVLGQEGLDGFSLGDRGEKNKN